MLRLCLRHCTHLRAVISALTWAAPANVYTTIFAMMLLIGIPICQSSCRTMIRLTRRMIGCLKILGCALLRAVISAVGWAVHAGVCMTISALLQMHSLPRLQTPLYHLPPQLNLLNILDLVLQILHHPIACHPHRELLQYSSI